MRQPRSEALAMRPTALGRVDGRVKVWLVFLFTVAVVAVPFSDPLPLAGLAPLLVLAVGAGDVPAGHLVRRWLMGLPFVGFVVVFPVLFQTREVSVAIGPWTPTLTEGSVRGVGVAAKYLLGFGAVVVLTSTTGFARVCNAMVRLRVPALFVATVALVWRYLFVLADEASRMLRARKARTARPLGWRLGWRSSAAVAAGLVGRALVRSERVHAAMMARGFSGELPVLHRERMGPSDWIVLAGGTLWTGACLAWTASRWASP